MMMTSTKSKKQVEYAALEMEDWQPYENNTHDYENENLQQQEQHCESQYIKTSLTCIRIVFLSNLPQWSTLFIFLTIISSTISIIPNIFMIRTILQLTGRWYFCAIAILPQWMEQIYISTMVQRRKRQSSSSSSSSYDSLTAPTLHIISQTSQIVYLLLELIVMIVLCIFYLRFLPWICKDVVLSYFTGVDGTLSMDWNHIENEFLFLYQMSRLTGCIYLVALSFGVITILSLISFKLLRTLSWIDDVKQEDIGINFTTRWCLPIPITTYLFQVGDYLSKIQFFIMTTLLFIALYSATIYLWINSADPKYMNSIGKYCDPLDTTECMLPFPSSFFTTRDDSTVTGIRVKVDIEAMTTLYRGPKVNKPIPLEIFDGFLTSGPILFYLEGLKEGQGLKYNTTTRLISFSEIQLSTTTTSMTLLLDLTEQRLVHHFAEIDSLNENLPVVIIQPAYPLKHNHRYAVALIDAIGAYGEKLHISPYLEILLDPERRKSLSETEKDRGLYFENKVIPILHDVAPWLHENNSTIQLLFDFHTMSANNQLGLTRKTVESSLNVVRTYDWNENVRIIKEEINPNCLDHGQSIDRILHLEVDLPNFMTGNDRMARLMDYKRVSSGDHNGMVPVKVVVLIPCKVASGIVPLRAMVQYGHGFLYSREEVLNMNPFHNIANEQGYLIFASNWRGMSYLDLPVIFKAFISEPELMLSIRDNIIQGYANMAALQMFSLNGLVDLCNHSVNIAAYPDKKIRSIYYGISQGGILGAAFSSLLAPHNLLDGSVIVSAGSPFSLLMSRSTIFPAYHELLRLGLHHDRHIRIFISILQMIYDTIEVGGIMSSNHDSDRVPTLLQEGLGDSTVSNIASEFLVRVYNASTFESNPVASFGVDIFNTETSKAVSTSILYVSENLNQPSHNSAGTKNNVHICTRIDRIVMDQMIEFCYSGEFLDVCQNEPLHCIRRSAVC